MPHTRSLLTIFALAALALVAEPDARAGGPVKQPHVTAELLSEHVALRPGGEASLLVRLAVDDGWHVYWKNPGDSGLAPALEWRLPEGFRAGETGWPVPERIEFEPIVNFGHERELLLPVRVRVPEALRGETVRLAVDASWLVCKDVCIVGEASLELELPVATGQPGVDAARKELFARARARLPVRLAEGAARATREGARTVLRVSGLEADGGIEFFPDDDQVVTYASATRMKGGKGELVVGLTTTKSPGARLRGVLAIGEGTKRKGYEIDAPLR